MEILREIGMIARCLDSISNIEFKDFQLSKGQYLYLVRICENPGIIQEKVAEMIKVDRTTAARAIQKLEMQELIEKRNDVENRKIKKLFPTEKGKVIFIFLKREEEHSEKVALNGFSQEEKEVLLNLLSKMRKNVEIDWGLVKKGHNRQY
nr:MarR family transcriptional regulator [Cytobacillus citreus]